MSLTVFVVDFLAALFRVAVNPDGQHALVLSAQHREQAVRGHMGERFRPVEIAAVLVGLVRGRILRLFGNDAAGAENLPHGLANHGCLAQALGDDVTGSGKGRLGVVESGRVTVRVRGGVVPHLVGKRLISGFLCRRRPCAPFRTVRKIEVLQNVRLDALLNLSPEFIGQRTGCGDGLKYAGLALFHHVEVLREMLYLRDRDIVQRARALFPVARDERHGRTLRQEFNGILDLPDLHSEVGGYFLQIYFLHNV